MSANITDYLAGLKARREADSKRFAELDGDLCQICWAYGADKRSWVMDCFYEVKEVLPEAIDLLGLPENSPLRGRGYYLRLCKSCRGTFLTALSEAANKRRALRGARKDHDGGKLWDDDPDRDIPVRINGATVFMDADEYADWWRARRKAPGSDEDGRSDEAPKPSEALAEEAPQ